MTSTAGSATPSPSQMFSFSRTPGTSTPAAAVEHVLVRLAVLLERPDVLPVRGPRARRSRTAARPLEQLAGRAAWRSRTARPRGRGEQLGLDHVDAGVDRVREDLAPGRLLQESLDAALLVGDHDAELERVVDRLERERREGAPLAVERDDLGEVEVAEGVTGDHDEGLVRSSRALRTEPAVPRGCSSTAYSMRTPSALPSPR